MRPASRRRRGEAQGDTWAGEEHTYIAPSCPPKSLTLPRFGFLVEFDDALGAVACGLQLQASLEARNACVPPERRIALRIGIHLGDVVHQDGDVFGEGVNLAARLEALVPPGVLYVSDSVARQVQGRVVAPLVRLGRGDLKRIRLPVAVYRIEPPVRRPRRSLLSRLAGWLPRPELRGL